MFLPSIPDHSEGFGVVVVVVDLRKFVIPPDQAVKREFLKG